MSIDEAIRRIKRSYDEEEIMTLLDAFVILREALERIAEEVGTIDQSIARDALRRAGRGEPTPKPEGRSCATDEALGIIGELMSYDNWEAYPPYLRERVKEFMDKTEAEA